MGAPRNSFVVGVDASPESNEALDWTRAVAQEDDTIVVVHAWEVPLVTGYDTHDLVAQVCRQDRAYSWQLLNRKIALKELAISGAEFNPAFRDQKRLRVARDLLFGNRWLYDELTANCADVVVADTLPELVERMNDLVGDGSVDLDAVTEAATRYDQRIALGPRFHNDEQLRRIEFARRWTGDRLRTCKFQPILDRKAGPLVAIREFIISRKSMGGLQTDLESRVLDQRGQPVPGAQIERSYSWTWKKQQGTDQASTDAQGRFQFPAMQGSSFFGGFLPHEPMVEQTILIHHGGKTYKAWMFDKRNYEQNGELAGKPIVLSCSLETEPRHSGKVFGICELK